VLCVDDFLSPTVSSAKSLTHLSFYSWQKTCRGSSECVCVPVSVSCWPFTASCRITQLNFNPPKVNDFLVVSFCKQNIEQLSPSIWLSNENKEQRRNSGKQKAQIFQEHLTFSRIIGSGGYISENYSHCLRMHSGIYASISGISFSSPLPNDLPALTHLN